MRVRHLVAAGLLAACVASPVAQAQQPQTVMQVFHDYLRDGRVDPCKHSTAELQYVRTHVPPDVKAYAADYPTAIKAALAARASGACSNSKPAAATATPTATAPATATATPAATATAAPSAPTATAAPQQIPVDRTAATQTSGSDATPLLALGILLAVLACLALLLVTMQRLGLGDERMAGTVHAWREARWRAGGTWEDFRDWLRLGR